VEREDKVPNSGSAERRPPPMFLGHISPHFDGLRICCEAAPLIVWVEHLPVSIARSLLVCIACVKCTYILLMGRERVIPGEFVWQCQAQPRPSFPRASA
jgi:hypothetical protein